MNIINWLLTPNKLNRLVLAPSYRAGDFDSHSVDGPVPFRYNGKFHMIYIGFDGIGYRTGLASSNDLITWKKKGLILDRGLAGTVTEFNNALTCILRDNDLFGSGELKMIDGKYIGVCHAFPDPGREKGSAVTCMCTSSDLVNSSHLLFE